MRVAIRSPAARATEIQLGLGHIYFRLKTSSLKLALKQIEIHLPRKRVFFESYFYYSNFVCVRKVGTLNDFRYFNGFFIFLRSSNNFVDYYKKLDLFICF